MLMLSFQAEPYTVAFLVIARYNLEVRGFLP